MFSVDRIVFVANCNLPEEKGKCVIKVLPPNSAEVSITRKLRNKKNVVRHKNHMPDNKNPDFAVVIMGEYIYEQRLIIMYLTLI